MIQGWLIRLRRWLTDASLFTHFPLIGFTALLPLLGAATIVPALDVGALAGLIGVAAAFHLFAYLLNDVVDLPLDRTEPLRAGEPLVRGSIARGTALALALLTIPAALAITALLDGGGAAYAALGGGLALIAVYDLWGKRTPWPPLTDLLQGVGWALLVVYGACVVGAGPTRLTLALAAAVVLYIAIVSGIHGSLRDVANDFRCGARTTAIVLGVRPVGPRGLRLTRPFLLYTLALEVGITGALLLPLLGNWFGYDRATLLLTAGVLGGVLLLIWLLLLLVVRAVGERTRMLFWSLWQSVLLIPALTLGLAPRLDRTLLAVVVAVLVLPFFSSELFATTIARVRRWRGVIRPALPSGPSALPRRK